MSKWLNLLRRLSSQSNERNQNPKTPGISTDKTDKSPFGSFVSSYPEPFPTPHLHLTDLLDQFEERAAIVEHDGGLVRIETEHLALVELLNAKAGAKAAINPYKPSGPVDAEPVSTEAGTCPMEAILKMTALRKPDDELIARIKAAELIFIAYLESEADEPEPSSRANQPSAKANPFPAPDTSYVAFFSNQIVRAIRDQRHAYRKGLAPGAILAWDPKL